jgi:hypothetical protein
VKKKEDLVTKNRTSDLLDMKEFLSQHNRREERKEREREEKKWSQRRRK